MLTADVAVPFFVALSSRQKCKIKFITFDRVTFELIKENELIFSAIESIGCLMLLSPKATFHTLGWLKKIYISFVLLYFLFLKIFFSKTYFVHFKQLNDGPLSFLGKICEQKTIFMQSGPSMSDQRIDQHIKKRKTLNNNACGKTLFYFDSDVFKQYNFDIKRQNQFLLPITVAFREWDDFRIKFLSEKGLGNSNFKTVSFILSSIDTEWLDKPFLDNTDFFSLFVKSLDLLTTTLPDYQILIKLHPVTNAKTKAKIEKIVDQYSRTLNVQITSLNPSLLSAVSDMVLANIASSTFLTFKFYKVPTIEYSCYHADVLKLTAGKSFSPKLVDFFVNGSEAKFKGVLTDLSKRKTRENFEYMELPEIKLLFDRLV